ncbi:MAG: single-stranded DNA-binding protein [Saprospiraceae bacterium]
MSNPIKNSVQLIGNIGKEPEFSTFDNGNKRLSFSLATNDYYTNSKGEKVKQTEWHNIIAWGKVADYMQKTVSKGQEIAIQGKLTSRSYNDKSGASRQITEIIVQDYYPISRQNQGV